MLEDFGNLGVSSGGADSSIVSGVSNTVLGGRNVIEMPVNDYFQWGTKLLENESESNLIYSVDADGAKSIGEHNSRGILHGRGIKIYSDGSIDIRYWYDGNPVLGSFISIYSWGKCKVGEEYLDSAGRWRLKFYQFGIDGSSQKYD